MKNTILSKTAFEEDFEDTRKFDAESAITYGFIDVIIDDKRIKG